MSSHLSPLRKILSCRKAVVRMKTGRCLVSSTRSLRVGEGVRISAFRVLRLSANRPRVSCRVSAQAVGSTAATTSWVSEESRTFELTPIGTPVPRGYCKNLVLKASDLRKNGRLIVVGDVHGCYEDFCKLLGSLNFDEDKDNLVMAGDLVNKGPDSLRVLKKAMKLGAYVVRGNHEDQALAAYYDYLRGEPILEKYHWVKDLKKKHLRFLENLPFSISIPSYKLIVVHAGLVPGTPLEKQDMFSMYKMRDLKKCEVRQSWIPLERGNESSIPWASQWQGPFHVIFGHDSSRRLQFHPYATGIDTGAVQGDELSACVFPPANKIPDPQGPAFRENLGMKIVSVDVDEPRKVSYPKPLPEILISTMDEAENLCIDMYSSFTPREPQLI